MWGSQELTQNLSPEALPGCNVTVTPSNSRIFEKSLGNGLVFPVLPNPETLSQTRLAAVNLCV